jgi:RHS repeat-associated protein
LTGKTPTVGSAPSMSVGAPATNQTMGGSYDANGNWVGGVPYYSNTWDVENRLVATANSTQATNYSYDPWGRRMWEEIPGLRDSQNNQLTNTTCEIYFYGVTGQKLETYSCSYTGGGFVSSLEGINIYFGKKLLQSKGAWVVTDKLGTVRANASLGAINYFPYGEERTSTANGVEKFGTYTRDAVGQDYAQQRYYNSSVGAFWTPDSGGIKTANPRNPLSWNRYAYTKGNPINRFDPSGRIDCDPDDDDGCYCDDDPDGDGCTCSDDGSECDSGGGSDPAPQKPAKPKKQIQSELDKALKAAEKALANNPACDSLFGLTEGSPNPSQFLQQLFPGIQIGDITSAPGTVTSATTVGTGPIPVPIGDGATQILYSGVVITINDLAGTFITGNTQSQAVTLLHELGHAYDDMYGPTSTLIESDAGSTAQSMANTALVQKNCFNN